MTFYGDTSAMYGLAPPPCDECGEAMTPKVFLGYVYGYRCENCNPNYSQIWRSKGGGEHEHNE